MAVYKNREVAITNITALTADPVVTISWDNGLNTEQVKLAQLKLTKAELDYFKKNNPAPLEGIEPISDKDVESVRLGNPPSYDKEAQDRADQKALRERAQQAYEEDEKRRKAEADKKVDAKIKGAK